MDLSLTIQVLLCYNMFGTDTWSNKSRSSPFRRPFSFLNAGQSETPRFLLLTNLIVAKALCAMSEKIQTPVLSDPRLVTVCNYMDANLGNKLVNTDLAQLV